MIYFMNSSNTIVSSGHVGERMNGANIMYAQADGDELVRALAIIGRKECPNRVHTFVGDTAKEIFINWK